MQHDPKRSVALTLVLFPVAAWLAVAHHYWRISSAQSYWQLAKATPYQTSLIVALAVGFVAAIALIAVTFAGSRSAFSGAPYRKLLRGPLMVTQSALARRTRERGKQQVTIAGVPMPTQAESRHLVLVGATGVGKSSYLRELLWSIMQRRGDRCVIVDPDGALYERFGRSEDVIMNPFDKRTKGWSILNEMREDYDYERFARSLIPLGKTAEEEIWCGYARDLLTTIARKLALVEDTSIKSLFHWSVICDTKELKAFLAGTNEESLFNEGLEKLLGSIRFTIKSNLRPHLFMPAGDFSIRDWLTTGSGNMYITWRDSMRAALAPLNGSWIDVICSLVLDVPESEARPLWLLVGELGSMGKLASLQDALTMGRKHGLRVVAELIGASQLRDIYGDHPADTLLTTFRSSVVFAPGGLDTKTKELMSKAIGEHEVERTKESTSTGRNRSTNKSTERSKERVVSDAELSAQRDLTGILTLPGGFPTAQVTLIPQNFVVRNQAFVDA